MCTIRRWRHLKSISQNKEHRVKVDFIVPLGGSGGTQTLNLLVANQLLYQLSYTPKMVLGIGFEPITSTV